MLCSLDTKTKITFNLNFFIFVFLLLVTLLERFLSLYYFAFNLIDDDQAVMWYATNEFAEGRFHAPRFFGQDYNSHLEALFAVPLYLLGLPLNYSLPIISSLMTLAPLWLLSILAYRTKNYLASFLILGWLIIAPIEFSIITSIPRGFVTGVFVSSLGCLIVLKILLVDRIDNSKLLILSGFLTLFGVSLNPNAGLIYAAAILLLLSSSVETKKWSYTYSFIAGSLIALFLHYFIGLFYNFYPHYALHSLPNIKWNLKFLGLHLSNLDLFWSYFTVDSFRSLNILYFIFVIIIALFLHSKRRILSFTWLTILVLIVLSLGFNKIGDGDDDIYIPYARMYLALPFICSSFFLLATSRQNFASTSRISIIFVLVISSLFTLKLTNYEQRHLQLAQQRSSQVKAMWLSTFYKACDHLDQTIKDSGAEIVVFSEFRASKILNYACPLYSKHSFDTLFPQLERRSWLLENELKLKRTNFLLYEFPSTKELAKKNKVKSIALLSTIPRIYQITTEPSELLKLLRRAGFVVNLGKKVKD